MAYPKRVYTEGIEEVTYQDMNRIETGIETNDIRITELEETTADHATKLTELDNKNTEQDTAIANKVNNSTFTAAKSALETKDQELQLDINTRVKSSTYEADKTGLQAKDIELDTAITEKVKINGESANVNFIEDNGVIKSVNDKKFASSTDYVTNRGGLTQDEINSSFYVQQSREFSGTSISVSNGLRCGYVTSGLIEGQTVKNYAIQSTSYGNLQNFTLKGAWGQQYNFDSVAFEASKTYYVTLNVREFNSTSNLDLYIRLKGFRDIKLGQITKAGKYVFMFNSGAPDTVPPTLSHLRCTLGASTDNILVDYFVITDVSVDINGFFAGLSSTQAVLNVNGLKYSFYKDATDKASGTVLQLGGIEGARNTLQLMDDGSGVFTQNFKDGTINNLTTFNNVNLDMPNTIRFLTTSFSVLSGALLGVLCENLPTKNVHSLDEEGIYISGSAIYIRLLRTKLTTQDVNGISEYFRNNPSKIKYISSAPVVTTIPKEIVPVILTQTTNNITLDSAVAPYSMTLQIPTTDDIKKAYSVTLLNGYTQTTSTATPVVNLLNTGIVRLQMDLTAPSTGMNATLFTLPTELRPTTSARIPVYVNDVSQLATIDKTTGSVNLASVPSASANIYIKTDYRRDI